jgi:hypothetical protein
MHVTAEPDGDPVRRDGEWTVKAHVTVRMTASEHAAMDGLRYEVFPWIRFRLQVCKHPQGAGPAGWHYQVHDMQRPPGETVVRSGHRPAWEAALEDGLGAILNARWAALDEEDSRR